MRVIFRGGMLLTIEMDRERQCCGTGALWQSIRCIAMKKLTENRS